MLGQETHKAMLAQALEGAVSEEAVKDEEQESSDEDGGIGFGKPAEKKRRTKGEQGEPSGPAPSRQQQKRKAAAVPQPALSEHVKSAESCLSSLKALTPQALWQGSLKLKEVDKRLCIALEVLAALEEFLPSSQAAQDISKQVTEASQGVSDWADVIMPFKDGDNALLYAQDMDDDDIKKFNRCLPAECMHSMVMDIGKRLWEAGHPTN